jgi:hypothetical protein
LGSFSSKEPECVSLGTREEATEDDDVDVVDTAEDRESEEEFERESEELRVIRWLPEDERDEVWFPLEEVEEEAVEEEDEDEEEKEDEEE